MYNRAKREVRTNTAQASPPSPATGCACRHARTNLASASYPPANGSVVHEQIQLGVAQASQQHRAHAIVADVHALDHGGASSREFGAVISSGGEHLWGMPTARGSGSVNRPTPRSVTDPRVRHSQWHRQRSARKRR